MRRALRVRSSGRVPEYRNVDRGGLCEVLAQRSCAHRRGGCRVGTGARGLRLEQQELERRLADNGGRPRPAETSCSAPSSGRTASTRSTQCANSSWLQWLVPIHVLPRLTELDDEEQLRAVAAAHGVPSVANGGVTGRADLHGHVPPEPRRQVERRHADHLGRRRVHAGTHTSKTKGSLSTTGYDQITASTRPTRRPRWCTSRRPYNDWPDVHGRLLGRHPREGEVPGRARHVGKTMQTSIPFSGGPWVLTSFTRTRKS